MPLFTYYVKIDSYFLFAQNIRDKTKQVFLVFTNYFYNKVIFSNLGFVPIVDSEVRINFHINFGEYAMLFVQICVSSLFQHDTAPNFFFHL